MRAPVLAFSDRMYRAWLQAYPAAFRARFAAEMAQVFQAVCQAAYAEAGASGVMRLWLPALWDEIRAMGCQWWAWLLKWRPEMMPSNALDQRDGIQPLTPRQASAAVVPFLAFGASSLVSKLDYFHTLPPGLPIWLVVLIHPFLIFNWLMLLGLGVGLLAGFPRWTYAFLGWALLFAGWWTDMRFYGFALGWRIWLPLLGVVLAALFIRRSYQPLRALFAGVWRDWTLLALGLYLVYAFVFMLYDENHSPYLLILIAATTLVAGQGAAGYFRAASPLDRVWALIGGLVRMAIIGWVNNFIGGDQTYPGLPANGQNPNLLGIVFFIGLGLVLLGIGWLATWRQRHFSGLRRP
jgi:hypothetical protein